MPLRHIYGMLLKNPHTSISSRLLWGKFRQKLFAADAYWDVIDFVRGNKVQTFLDVGMHRGMYTDMILRTTPDVAILGFEPTPATYASLVAKYESAKRVEILNCALSDTDGRHEFFCNHNEQTNSLLAGGSEASLMGEWMETSGTVEVEVRKLDSILIGMPLRTPLFVKIDVQGAEALVVRGGSDGFRNKVEGCLMEIQLHDIYQGQGRLTEMLVLMDELGFVIRQVYPALVMSNVAVQLEILFVKRSTAVPSI